VQLDWATPLLAALGAARLHLQVSSGYGETLIDYNHNQTTVGVGVSFGNW
jgi:phospholipase A1